MPATSVDEVIAIVAIQVVVAFAAVDGVVGF